MPVSDNHAGISPPSFAASSSCISLPSRTSIRYIYIYLGFFFSPSHITTHTQKNHQSEANKSHSDRTTTKPPNDRCDAHKANKHTEARSALFLCVRRQALFDQPCAPVCFLVEREVTGTPPAFSSAGTPYPRSKAASPQPSSSIPLFLLAPLKNPPRAASVGSD